MVVEGNGIPTVDLKNGVRSELSTQILEACQEFGFFKVVNHDVSSQVIDELEVESLAFFAKPDSLKELANYGKPFGYGAKNIGPNGDTGDIEYILLRAKPDFISESSTTISDDPSNFSSAAIGYVEAVKGLACYLLELMMEGLKVPDTTILSRMINDEGSDSVFRINHYPVITDDGFISDKIGFGEHSDPQILTILRSNDIPGLQIRLKDGDWVPVVPDPTAFFVNVGDLVEAMTNGRFVSVRHKAIVGAEKKRMSMAYFASPPLEAKITELPCEPKGGDYKYREFTWSQYKRLTYSLRLADTRLNTFRAITKIVDNEPVNTDVEVPTPMEDVVTKLDQAEKIN